MGNDRTVGGGLLSVLGCVFIVGLASCQIVEAPAADSGEPSLRTVYKERFPIGVALGGWLPGEYNSRELGLIRSQFDVVTPTNCMKMKRIQGRQGEFAFDHADNFMAFAVDNRLGVCGHCLVWAKDGRTPGWFFKDGEKTASREMLLSRMKEHIQTVAGRYRGKIIFWDVVNEALADDEKFLRPSQYLDIVGDDFIARAFEYARQADPDAVLVYNDYNLFFPHKHKKLVRLLRMLVEQKAPIDAVGIQGHFELDQIPYDQIEEVIKTVRSFGLKVVVAELDIDVVLRSKWWADGGKYRDELSKYDPYADGCPPEVLERQAEQYAKLFALFSKYADCIGRVTFWNLHDGRSWLNDFPWKRSNYPLLFDGEAQFKPAFWAVLSAQ